jgi:hypothetical protein
MRIAYKQTFTYDIAKVLLTVFMYVRSKITADNNESMYKFKANSNMNEHSYALLILDLQSYCYHMAMIFAEFNHYGV